MPISSDSRSPAICCRRPGPAGSINDGIVATGLLAIADFVPGDVDKDQMIADYVNDQVDLVGKAFLGLSIALRPMPRPQVRPDLRRGLLRPRGHLLQHEPGPRPGARQHPADPRAAPLRRTSSPGCGRQIPRQAAAGGAGAAAPRRGRPGYLAHLGPLITGQTRADYLVAACEYRRAARRIGEVAPGRAGQAAGASPALAPGWVDYLDRVRSNQRAAASSRPCDAAAGQLSGPALTRAAEDLERALADLAARRESATARSSAASDLSADCVLRFRADDPYLVTDPDSRVTLWPNRSGRPADARPPTGATGPVRATAAIDGRPRAVLRFDGRCLLEAPRAVPPSGSLFVVFQTADGSDPAIGWSAGRIPTSASTVWASCRSRATGCRRSSARTARPATWPMPAPRSGVRDRLRHLGPGRHDVASQRHGAGSQKGIDGVSSDPGIVALRIGGPGSGSSARFRGELAELRVYGRQLDDAGRKQVEAELHRAWFEADVRAVHPAIRSPSCSTSCSPPADRSGCRPRNGASCSRRSTGRDWPRWRRELETLKKKPAIEIPQAVAVQDGGPKGTRHEGFKDARLFVRGNHKKPGKTVPRGFPRILTIGQPARITEGSGRRQLADWLARPDHPLTARVMVNRIWQHHFGEGLVRTANDFGQRGDRPRTPSCSTCWPPLRRSGWSVKAMHRLIMLSSTYQQTARVEAATARARTRRIACSGG